MKKTTADNPQRTKSINYLAVGVVKGVFDTKQKTLTTPDCRLWVASPTVWLQRTLKQSVIDGFWSVYPRPQFLEGQMRLTFDVCKLLTDDSAVNQCRSFTIRGEIERVDPRGQIMVVVRRNVKPKSGSKSITKRVAIYATRIKNSELTTDLELLEQLQLGSITNFNCKLCGYRLIALTAEQIAEKPPAWALKKSPILKA